MILDRLVIAGLGWTGRALFASKKASKVSRPRTVERSRSERREPARATAPDEPVETQQVVAPDQDLLESLNPDDVGFGAGGPR